MNRLMLLLGSTAAVIGWAGSAGAVPPPVPLEQLVPRATWVVVGELGPLRPASPGEKMARHGDIRVEEVLKGPADAQKPRQLTLFTLDPKLLDTPDAPVGVIMYKPGMHGIWLLEPLEDGVYQAANPNSFLPLKQRSEVDRLLPVGSPPPREKGAARVVVADDGSADCRTITEALAAVADGGEVRVRPGVYREAVHVDRTVTIVGDGPREKVVIQSAKGDCLYLEAGRVTVRNLRLDCRASPEAEFYAVDVAAGEATLEDCDLASQSLACLGVHGKGTRAIVRNCRIHDGNDAGVFVYEGGVADLQGCEIFGNKGGNVVVWAGAGVSLRRCVLHGSPDVGLDVRKGGRAALVECRISRNKGGPFNVVRKANVTLLRCTVGEESGTPADPVTTDPPPKPGRDLGPIIKVLEDSRSSFEQLDEAVSGLRIGDREAVPAVQALLASEEPGRRAVGIRAVVQIGSAAEPAVGALIKILREDRNLIRTTGAAYALGRIGTQDPEAVRALADTLRDPNEIFREAAAVALQDIGPPAADKAIADLRRLRDDPARRVRAAAAAADAALSGDAEAIRSTAIAIPIHAQSVLCKQLATALGIAGEKQDVHFASLVLITQIKFDQTTGREEIAFALARMKPELDEEARRNIEQVLGATEPQLRWCAAVALLNASPDHARASEVFRAALPAMIEYYEERIAEKPYPERVKRTFFCEVCTAHSGMAREAVPLLRLIARDAPDAESRQAATQALGKFGERIVPEPVAPALPSQPENDSAAPAMPLAPPASIFFLGASRAEEPEVLRLRYDYRKGDAGRVRREMNLKFQLDVDGEAVEFIKKSAIDSVEEVLGVEKGQPLELRKRITSFELAETDFEAGKVRGSAPLKNEVEVRIDRSLDPPSIETVKGTVTEELQTVLGEEAFFLDVLPRQPVKVGDVFKPPPRSLAEIQEALDESRKGKIRFDLRCEQVREFEVAGTGADGKPVGYVFKAVEISVDWEQEGEIEEVPFTLRAAGRYWFAVDAGVLLQIRLDGRIQLKPTRVEEGGKVVTIKGEGTVQFDHRFEPANWERGVLRRTSGPTPPDKLPVGWKTLDDKLHGTRVAIPPGWTPRVRGDVVLCIEQDGRPHTAVFFLPLRLGGNVTPADLASGFDAMLRRALPSWETKAMEGPSPDSVQRELSATVEGKTLAGVYRAAVGKRGTGFVMGYVAPADGVDGLRPTFHRILSSYRYTGPRMQLHPYRSPGNAIELRIPRGWKVVTSEGMQGAKPEIDWEVRPPDVQGARAFMTTRKYFTSNWIRDVLTRQIDPTNLALWRNKGFEMADLASDDEALKKALEAELPGLAVSRMRKLDEPVKLYERILAQAIETTRAAGGRMTLHCYEIQGVRRLADGGEHRVQLTVGMAALVVPGGIKGMAAIWTVNIRGLEAPAEDFVDLALTLDRIDSSFNYTLRWVREVMEMDEQQAETYRRTMAAMNRIDREMWDSHLQTRDAVNEMMYDTLTANYGFANDRTKTIEKIPADELDKYRSPTGEVRSPEEIARGIPPSEATILRDAGADDYMAFDRRAYVWP